MPKEKISIKFLIHLVGERPALWDKTSEAYKDRSLKETSWREICTFITENYDHMPSEPKQEFTKMVMKKWTHIRDSWVKSMKYGYDEKTKLPPKPYVYHNELQFMQKILKCKPRRYDFTIPKLDSSNFESFYGEKDGTQNCISYEDQNEDEEGDNENQQSHDDTVENLKQEHSPQNDVIENNVLIEENDDDDDWPLDEAHTPIIEIKRDPNHVMQTKNDNKLHQQQKQQHQQQPKRFEVKRPYTTIFKSSRRDEEEPCSSSVSFSSNKYLNENRHWNFFKGILPSVNTLNEDHTLQFQAGVITLLQKMRTSQKHTSTPNKSNKSSGRKRKASDDGDYEWPIHKVNINKRYSTRNSRNISDPIGGEDLVFESDNSSDNE